MKYTTKILKNLVIRSNCEKFAKDMKIRSGIIAEEIVSSLKISVEEKEKLKEVIVVGLEANWYKFYTGNEAVLGKLIVDIRGLIVENITKTFWGTSYIRGMELVCDRIGYMIKNIKVEVSNEEITNVPYAIAI